MATGKVWLRRARERGEGWLVFWFCLIFRIDRTAPRIRRFKQVGFRDVRAAWWPMYVSERARDIWRYLLLLEWFEQKNRRSKRSYGEGGEDKDIQRILFISPSHFGDTLHLVPLLRALRETKPSVSIELLAGPWVKDLVRRIPYIDHTYYYAPKLDYLHRGHRDQCLSLVKECQLMGRLRANEYDISVVTRVPAYIDLFMVSAVGARRWVGHSSGCGLYDDLGSRAVVPYDAGQYECDRLSDMGKYLGVSVGDRSLAFWIDEDEEARAQAVLDACGLVERASWIVLCPGAGWKGKEWSPERFAEVADRLCVETGCKVLICGAPNEQALVERVAAHMQCDAVKLSGNIGWGELAVLIRDAALFLGNDSGPMHLAAVYHTPTVALFGPTPPKQWAPKGENVRVLRAVDGCRDCWSWYPWTCSHGGQCMKQIEVNEVVQAGMDVINQE